MPKAKAPDISTRYEVITQEDPETGDLIMPLPPDLLDLQGWKTGDTLEWIDNKDGSWTLQKSTKST